MDGRSYTVTITWYKDAILVEDNESNMRWFNKSVYEGDFLQLFLDMYQNGQKPEECIDLLHVKDKDENLLSQTHPDKNKPDESI